MRGYATSDRGNKSKLVADVAGNLATKITNPAGGSGAAENTGKRFRIAVAKIGTTPRYKRSQFTYEVKLCSDDSENSKYSQNRWKDFEYY